MFPKRFYAWFIIIFFIVAILFVFTPTWYHQVFKGEEYSYLFERYEPIDEEYNAEYVITQTCWYLFFIVISIGSAIYGLILLDIIDGGIDWLFDILMGRNRY